MYRLYDQNMSVTFAFNEEKNQLLKATRGVSFDDILLAIEKRDLVDNISHPSRQHPKQRILLVRINQYVYVVPYVYQKTKRKLFLKTLYPSRVMTKNFAHRKEKNAKKIS